MSICNYCGGHMSAPFHALDALARFVNNKPSCNCSSNREHLASEILSETREKLKELGYESILVIKEERPSGLRDGECFTHKLCKSVYFTNGTDMDDLNRLIMAMMDFNE